MRIRRFPSLAGAVLLSLVAASAWAVDLSCIGVQSTSASWAMSQLPADDQSRLQPAVARLQAMAEDAAVQVRAAEAAQQQDLDSLRSGNPDASPKELSQLYYQAVQTSAEFDNHYAAALVAQHEAHMTEGVMIAAASAIPAPQEQARMEKAADSLTARAPHAQGLRADPTLNRLVTVVAAADLARRAGVPVSARGVAAVGWDTAGHDRDNAQVLRDLTVPTVAASAMDVAGMLRLAHLTNQDARDKDFRLAVVRDPQSISGREIARDAASALEGMHGAAIVIAKIARVLPPPTEPATAPHPDSKVAPVIPPSPVPSAPAPSLGAQFVERAKTAAQEATLFYRKNPARIIETTLAAEKLTERP